MTLVRSSDGAVVASSLELAKSFGSRTLGLMFRGGLAKGAGLWIEPCSSIHMMFVFFRIDAVFVDEDGKVLKIARRLLPWLGLAWCLGARAVVELEAGAAERVKLVPGDRLVQKPGGDA